MAVDSLWLNLTNGNDIGGGKPVLTGPSIVDSDQHRPDPALHRQQQALTHVLWINAAAQAWRRSTGGMTATSSGGSRAVTCGAAPPGPATPPWSMTMSSPATTPATQPTKTTDAPAPVKKSLFARVLTRPEIGAVAAAIAIFIFFFAIAPPFRTLPSFSTVLYASSTIGIVAVGVALLMIGGEFDLSSGVTVVTAALCAALVSFQLSLNMWVGVLVSLIVALGIGFINGYLVVKTKIPSFLITLSTFFMLRGINLGVTKAATGTVATDNVSGLDGFLAAKALFASDIPLGFITVKVTVLWWLLFVAIGTWILLRTKVGNWIFAAGGNADSARAVGVPVPKVKIGLFMGVSFLGWFYGMHLLFNFSSVQSGLGIGNEFIYIIAAVVGGCLLTGGYGSVVGAAVGAFIFGMTTQGIVFAGFDPNWFYTFLGAMLLLAVLVNLYIKNYAATRR